MAVHVQQYCSRCGGIGRYRTTTYNDAIVQIHVCDCAAGQQIIDTEARIQQLERENAGMRNVPKLPHGWALASDRNGRDMRNCRLSFTDEEWEFFAALLNAVYPLPSVPNQEG